MSIFGSIFNFSFEVHLLLIYGKDILINSIEHMDGFSSYFYLAWRYFIVFNEPKKISMEIFTLFVYFNMFFYKNL
jgi:hypothetical protein